MVHHATVFYRVSAACQLVFAAVAITVCALSDVDPIAIAVAAVLLLFWVALVASLSRRPARAPLPSGTRLAPAGRSARTALLIHLASLVVFVPALLLSRGDGGGWNLCAILLGSGVGYLVVLRRVAAQEARDPAVLQTVRIAWRRRGGRVEWPREWGDTAPAGATSPAA